MNIVLVIMIIFAILYLYPNIRHYQGCVTQLLTLILSSVFKHNLLQQILASTALKLTDNSSFIQLFIKIFVLVDQIQLIIKESDLILIQGGFDWIELRLLAHVFVMVFLVILLIFKGVVGAFVRLICLDVHDTHLVVLIVFWDLDLEFHQTALFLLEIASDCRLVVENFLLRCWRGALDFFLELYLLENKVVIIDFRLFWLVDILSDYFDFFHLFYR